MTSGDDPRDHSQPYLFGAALDDAEREDEAREKRDELNLCCGVCNGSGEGYADGTKCRKCGGSGTLEKWPRKQEAKK